MSEYHDIYEDNGIEDLFYSEDELLSELDLSKNRIYELESYIDSSKENLYFIEGALDKLVSSLKYREDPTIKIVNEYISFLDSIVKFMIDDDLYDSSKNEKDLFSILTSLDLETVLSGR